MTDENIVLPEDIETPAPVEPEVPENDEELNPEESPLPPANETAEQKDARLAALEERNEKLWARLQREKNKSKQAPPAAPAAKPAEPAQPASLTREEAILFAQGLSIEEVEQAKKVATLQGVKLTEAITDDLFTGWKAKRDAEKKQQSAQLPASRGARSSAKKNFATPGLSDEEHKEMFKEKIGK